MITELPAGKRLPSRDAFLWRIGILLLVVTTTGCPRMVSMEYQPINPLKGQGTISILPFRYQASDSHRVRPRQVETDPSSKTELYLTQEINVFFTDALRKELTRSGYMVNDSSDRVVSGNIARFYIDWKNGGERSFDLAADYTVQSSDRTLFSWHCAAIQKGPNVLAEDGILIRKGIADCMQRFIAAAQEARVL